MIDPTHVKAVCVEVHSLLGGLHGQDLDETGAVEDRSKGKARNERAQFSQDLNLLATRLELAAALVRNEYWVARGETDPLDPARA